MSLRFTPATEEHPGRGRAVFVSASIPDPARWDGEFDALEITDAVVSLARTFLTAGWRLVSAAHPTIAPLLLYVAAEFPAESDARVIIYQSELFENVLPTATRRFEASGIGRLIWTPAAEDNRPIPGEWDESLIIMRHQMLTETAPTAAMFVGGMAGIPDEFQMFSRLYPDSPTYAIGFPGGAARELALQSDSALRDLLIKGTVYPSLWRAVLHDLSASS